MHGGWARGAFFTPAALCEYLAANAQLRELGAVVTFVGPSCTLTVPVMHSRVWLG